MRLLSSFIKFRLLVARRKINKKSVKIYGRGTDYVFENFYLSNGLFIITVLSQ